MLRRNHRRDPEATELERERVRKGVGSYIGTKRQESESEDGKCIEVGRSTKQKIQKLDEN